IRLPRFGPVLLLAACAVFASVCTAQEDSAGTTLSPSGLSYASSDQRFSLNVTTALMFQYTYHDVRASGRNGDNGADFSNFRLTGARSLFAGHVFGRQFQYRLWLAWASPAGSLRIEDAYFRWAPLPLLNITVGQMRVPASWEYLVDHERTGIPDRSVADSAFQQGWGKGATASGRAELWDAGFAPALLAWELGVFNGVLDGPDGSV